MAHYKHDYDKTLTRLTTILSRLNDGESLSVKDLAEDFNVSTRTIQRDFNERLISYPIYQESKKWKMQDGFKLEKLSNVEDTIILDIMEKISEGIGGKFATKSKHLLSKIKNEDFNPIYTKLNIEDISGQILDIATLENAIKDYKIISCQYSFESYHSRLDLKPLKVVNFEGFWYLVALDVRNDDLKKYYLKNISSIEVTNMSFELDNEVENLLDNSISVWFQKDVEPFEVKIFANSVATKYFKRRPLPTQTIESLHEDGTMEFVVKVTHEMEIIPIIKYWIPHLKVLEPQTIIKTIESDLKEYLEHKDK